MRVLVSVGTDVHPFDRLVEWADRWCVDHPEDVVEVQFGTSGPPTSARGTELFGRLEMLDRMAGADVVVLSCGPGAVMDARRSGRLPVVVARRPELGEHVDGHQTVFARHLGEHEMAVVVEDEAAFRQVLESVRARPQRFYLDVDREEPPGVRRFAAEVDGLVWGLEGK
jgi:UDP-N-acetylglucosamine transferase subunit ALG13